MALDVGILLEFAVFQQSHLIHVFVVELTTVQLQNIRAEQFCFKRFVIYFLGGIFV